MESKLLIAEEAALRLNVRVGWLYRHADSLPFTRRLAARTLRFDEAALEEWLAKLNRGGGQ